MGHSFLTTWIQQGLLVLRGTVSDYVPYNPFVSLTLLKVSDF